MSTGTDNERARREARAATSAPQAPQRPSRFEAALATYLRLQARRRPDKRAAAESRDTSDEADKE